jgi:hypothetical protein
MLRRREKFCCLGVLQNIIDDAPKDDSFYQYADTLLGSNKQVVELWKMNDGITRLEHSFEQIADYIEKNL